MNKTLASILSVFGLLAVVGFWFVSVNNTLVSKDEDVKAKWAQVESVYQRRMDLIPNLVNTVKGYATHEKETFEKITEARSKVGQVNINNASDLQAFEKTQTELKSALSRLMVVAEQYPNLKADAGFRDLQSQLEGTENRITIERQRFNESAQEYNVYIRKFPQSIVAGMKGFAPKAYFEAAAGAANAPKVQF